MLWLQVSSEPTALARNLSLILWQGQKLRVEQGRGEGTGGHGRNSREGRTSDNEIDAKTSEARVEKLRLS